MAGESPAAVLVNANGVELSVDEGSAVPVAAPSVMLSGRDDMGNARLMDSVRLPNGIAGLQTWSPVLEDAILLVLKELRVMNEHLKCITGIENDDLRDEVEDIE